MLEASGTEDKKRSEGIRVILKKYTKMTTSDYKHDSHEAPVPRPSTPKSQITVEIGKVRYRPRPPLVADDDVEAQKKLPSLKDISSPLRPSCFPMLDKIYYPTGYPFFHVCNTYLAPSDDHIPRFERDNYTEEVFHALIERDIMTVPIPFNPDLHGAFDTETRATILDWMFGLVVHIGLNTETFLCAVNYFERFNNTSRAPYDDHSLLATTCLFIAHKYCKKGKHFGLQTFTRYGKCDAEELSDMERVVLIELDYDLGYPGSFQFLARFSTSDNTECTLDIARYLTILCAVDHRISGVYAHLGAAASLYFARIITGHEDPWTPELITLSGVDKEKLHPVVNLLLHALMGPKTFSTLHNEYGRKRFSEAALVADRWVTKNYGAYMDYKRYML